MFTADFEGGNSKRSTLRTVWTNINIVPPRWGCGPRRGTKLHKLSLFALVAVLLVTFHRVFTVPFSSEFAPLSEAYLQWGPFRSMDLPGFLNSGFPGKRSCDTLKYNAAIGVQNSHHLQDDLRQIALSMETHPAVRDRYSKETLLDPRLKVDDVVNRNWARMSGSSVWLPQQGVFLVVSRVVFLGPKELLVAPFASFLRGQLFDENWKHLENVAIKWNDELIIFPLVFDIPTPYEGGDGEFYGPEDPRIVLEEGVAGAEPVIVFNMAHPRSDWKRAMYVFRPFSNYLTILTIRDAERPDKEKNWAPFFLSTDSSQTDLRPRGQPSEFLHFVYGFKPLQILKCHLRCGDCDLVFEQQIPETFVTHHEDDGGRLNGGTNFVPVPMPASYRIHPEISVYAGFPRTHVNEFCGTEAVKFYRPEFVVIIHIRSQFHLAFASDSLDFGSAILENGPTDDPCEKGLILMPNSVSRWESNQDVMTVTWSVDDKSIQVARIQGLLSFVRSLPQFHKVLRTDGPLKGQEHDLLEIMSSWVGDDVRACSVESVVNYTRAAKEIHGLFHPHPPEPAEGDHSMKLSFKVAEEAMAKVEIGKFPDR